MRMKICCVLSLIPILLAAGCSVDQSIKDSSCVATGMHNTVTCTSYRSEFNQKLGDQLIQKMPDKKKPINLQTVGGNKDQQVGNEVDQFLRQHGYSVQRSVIGMLAPPPDQFITLQIGDSQYTLVVAPSAH